MGENKSEVMNEGFLIFFQEILTKASEKFPQATFSGKRNKNKGENAARQAEAKEAKKKAKAEKKAKQKESKKRHGGQKESQRDHSGGSKILSWSVLNVKRPSESSGATASK